LQLFVYALAIMEALEMERPMTEWNDDRLDELNGRMKEGFAGVNKRFDQVDKRFEQVDERFVRLEGEMKEGFRYTDERMEAGFDRINGRLDRLYHVFIVTAAGAAATLLANGIWG
jgi:chromosome segregation ATPase